MMKSLSTDLVVYMICEKVVAMNAFYCHQKMGCSTIWIRLDSFMQSTESRIRRIILKLSFATQQFVRKRNQLVYV